MSEVELLRRGISERLFTPSLPKTEVHRDAFEKLDALVRCGIVTGESQSVVVMGPKGAGKTTLVNNVLESIERDTSISNDTYVVIEVNGFIHKNDASALKHIASSLCIIEENDNDEDGDGDRDGDGDGDGEEGGFNGKASYFNNAGELSGSAAETSLALREALLKGSQDDSKCIVIVVEEVDLFAHHGHQTLLYTLLDQTHHSAVPLVIVGVTRRMDIYSLFEKRVLSRFSQRFIHIINPWKTFNAYKRFVINLLKAPSDNPAISKQYQTQWNKRLKEISDSAALDQQLKVPFSVSTTDIYAVGMLVNQIISHVTEEAPLIKLDDVYRECLHQTQDCKVSMLLDLSALELCLVIAMNNLRYRLVLAFNFETVYETYKRFAVGMGQKISAIAKKSVALKAFENLCDLEFVGLQNTRHRSLEQTPINLLIDRDQVERAVEMAQGISVGVKRWAKSHM
eukprot:m.52802 g.52802  ORF g.52802 m.52802 type:complete len:455 (-) comp7635_c0_seq1:1469-2833(-)